jgi:hypothetical protein
MVREIPCPEFEASQPTLTLADLCVCQNRCAHLVHTPKGDSVDGHTSILALLNRNLGTLKMFGLYRYHRTQNEWSRSLIPVSIMTAAIA